MNRNRNDQPGDSRGLSVLLALSAPGRNVYAGTVPTAEVDRRRSKNRAARRARRLNRRAR